MILWDIFLVPFTLVTLMLKLLLAARTATLIAEHVHSKRNGIFAQRAECTPVVLHVAV